MKYAIMILTAGKLRSHGNTANCLKGIIGIDFTTKGMGIFIIKSDSIDDLFLCCYALGKKGITITHITQLMP